MADFLQYGAMGLLAVVLVAVGSGAREYLKRADERAQKRDEVRSEQDGFIRQIVEQDRVERVANVEALQGLVEVSVESNHAVAKVLDGICGELQRHEEQSVVRHDEVMRTA